MTAIEALEKLGKWQELLLKKSLSNEPIEDEVIALMAGITVVMEAAYSDTITVPGSTTNEVIIASNWLVRDLLINFVEALEPHMPEEEK